MLFRFDMLPLEDVIHETIMLMLDYESRIAFNQCFTPNERYISRFLTNEIIRHELFIASDFLKYKLDKIENTKGETRKLRMKRKSQLVIQLLHCFEPGNRNLLIMQHYPRFHAICIRKLQNFTDSSSVDLLHSSRYFRKKIGDLARKLLPHLQNIVPAPNPMQGVLKPIVVKGFL